MAPAGRSPNEGRNILIDDAAAAAHLGFTPQQAVGKTIILGKSHVQIVGVLADVKFDGAREPAMADACMSMTRQTRPVQIAAAPEDGAIPDPGVHRPRPGTTSRPPGRCSAISWIDSLDTAIQRR